MDRGVMEALLVNGMIVLGMVRRPLAAMGLTPMEFTVLSALSGDVHTCSALAKNLRQTRQNMRTVLRELMEAGLVCESGRWWGASLFQLTAQGNAALSSVRSELTKLERRFRCEPWQVELFVRLLEGCRRDLLYEGSPIAEGMLP